MNDEQNNHIPIQENPTNRAKLYASLAAAQGDLTNPKNDTEGYNYKYATLDQIIDIIRPVMAKHGLCYVQSPVESEDGHVSVMTTIGHESGESIISVLTMPIVENGRNNSAQNYGGTLTYIRRYALSSALGICSEEDKDGEGKDRVKKQVTEKPDLVSQCLKRIETFEVGEMCAASGYDPRKAAEKTNKAFMAQSESSLTQKLKAFNKRQQEQEEEL